MSRRGRTRADLWDLQHGMGDLSGLIDEGSINEARSVFLAIVAQGTPSELTLTEIAKRLRVYIGMAPQDVDRLCRAIEQSGEPLSWPRFEAIYCSVWLGAETLGYPLGVGFSGRQPLRGSTVPYENSFADTPIDDRLERFMAERKRTSRG